MSAAIPGGRSEIESLIAQWRERVRVNTGANFIANRVGDAVQQCIDELQSALLTAAGSAPVPNWQPRYEELVKARNGLRDAIVNLRGGIFLARQDDADTALAALDIAIGKAFSTSAIERGAAVPARVPPPDIRAQAETYVDDFVTKFHGLNVPRAELVGWFHTFGQHVLMSAARPSLPVQEPKS